jgi:hypothetical protein
VVGSNCRAMPIIQQSVVEVTGIRNDRLNACPTSFVKY